MLNRATHAIASKFKTWVPWQCSDNRGKDSDGTRLHLENHGKIGKKANVRVSPSNGQSTGQSWGGGALTGT